MKKIIFLSLSIIAVAGSFCLGVWTGRNQVVVKAPSTAIVSPTAVQIPTVTEKAQWKTAEFGDFFYEYPVGWHVAEIWQAYTGESGVSIVVDQKPVSTAPRGGPLGTFEIRVDYGNTNPDEILAKKLSDFNDQNYTDITKETINGNTGEIYHYKGKFAGEMMKGTPIESYLFTFDKKAGEPHNQKVIIATTFKDDIQLSSMLRHIVLSIKKIR